MLSSLEKILSIVSTYTWPYFTFCKLDRILLNDGISLIEEIEKNKYNGILISVAHQEFKELGVEEIRSYGTDDSVLFDLKNLFNSNDTDGRL